MSESEVKDHSLATTDQKQYIFGIRRSALFEILGFFALLTLIAILFSLNINYFKASPHPFWIIVILISTQYGTLEGLLAAFIATLFFFLGTIPPRTILQDHAEYFLFAYKLPILWFVTALILGELRLRQIREKTRLQEIAFKAEEEQKKVANAYEALKKIKERLEMKVASEMKTTLMVISSFKNLEQTDRQGLIAGAMDLVKTLIAPEKFSLYLLVNDKLLQFQNEGWNQEETFSTEFAENSLLYQTVIAQKKSLSIQTFDPTSLGNEGVMAVPLMALPSKKVYGMIKVEQIPFIRVNSTTLETLETIGEWVGTACETLLSKERSAGGIQESPLN